MRNPIDQNVFNRVLFHIRPATSDTHHWLVEFSQIDIKNGFTKGGRAMKIKDLLTILIVCAWVLSACQSNVASEPTSTMEPTATIVVLTDTLVPTCGRAV